MYCMGCGKEFENGMFCPECGRMLVGDNTYQHNTSIASKKHEQWIDNQSTVKQPEMQKNIIDNNVPKCPTCGSTNIRRITATERGMNAVMFGVFGTKRKCQFECQNPNCKYRW